MKKKVLLAVLLAVVCVLVFVGCSPKATMKEYVEKNISADEMNAILADTIGEEGAITFSVDNTDTELILKYTFAQDFFEEQPSQDLLEAMFVSQKLLIYSLVDDIKENTGVTDPVVTYIVYGSDGQEWSRETTAQAQ